MNFIVPDDSDDEAPGSEDYFTSDTELNHECKFTHVLAFPGIYSR